MSPQVALGCLKNAVRPLQHYNLINESISKRIIDLINPTNSTLIVPYSDYPGVLSKSLLSSSYSKLVMGIGNISLKPELERYIKTHHPERNVEVLEHDIIVKSFNVNCDDSQDVIQNSLSGCCHEKDWKILNKNKIIIPLLTSKYEATFLTSLYFQMAHRNGLHTNGRMQFYMFLSGRQNLYLQAKPSSNLRNYRSSTVLYNTVFDLEVLDTMNLKEAFDINLKKIQNTKNTPATNPRSEYYNKVHLVKITPKYDVFERFSPNSLLEYRFLVRQCMQSRTAFVIPFMERWFPNCRGDLYRLGFDTTKRFGDMTSYDLTKLYIYVSTRPDYHMSTMQVAATSIEGTVEEQEEPQYMGFKFA